MSDDLGITEAKHCDTREGGTVTQQGEGTGRPVFGRNGQPHTDTKALITLLVSGTVN